MSRFFRYFRISKPSGETVPAGDVQATYKRLRNRTFWGVASAYCLYYVCRMALSVVKQPFIDSGLLTAGQLGIIGSALLFAYAFGKFFNGFIADYCNIRRFMGAGLLVSAVLNLIMGALGLLHGWLGLSSVLVFIVFAVVWCLNGWAQSMGAPPAVISLSRWFSLKTRGTYYSMVCSTPYLGKALSLIMIGGVVAAVGWQWGFIFAAIAGVIGAFIIFLFVSDTPESKGLPSVQELSGEKPGTVLRGTPQDMAQAQGANMSLHDLRLVDLFDAAVLLGYEAEGVCIGVQVQDTEPKLLTEDLTPPVKAALPLLVETVAAELARLGSPLIDKSTGKPYLGK